MRARRPRPWRCALAALGALGALTALAACEPALDQRLSILEEPRVLAVISEPAETQPQQSARHRVWIGGGAVELGAVDWAFCTEPKPPTEDNVVNVRCLGAAVRAAGSGEEITAPTPAEACMRFGPDVGAGGYRPRDPDITGGYFQPLRLTLPAAAGGEVAFASHRLRCGLANAPVEVARAFRERYVPNTNPPPPELRRRDGGGATARRGERVALLATWPERSAERYVWFDAGAGQLRDRRESLRISWYATAGRLCSDATGRAEEDLATESENCWSAPDAPGPVTIWLVLRDSRGGAAVLETTLDVEP